jgi:hypothetical protein
MRMSTIPFDHRFSGAPRFGFVLPKKGSSYY